MSLNKVSPLSKLHLWSEFEQAYFGANGFGGNVAEIYAYRLIPRGHTYAPPGPNRTGMFAEDNEQMDRDSAIALYELLVLFKEHRDCHIRIYDRALGPWLKKQMFDHRVHVEIKPKK